jgi:hypothetical protein
VGNLINRDENSKVSTKIIDGRTTKVSNFQLKSSGSPLSSRSINHSATAKLSLNPNLNPNPTQKQVTSTNIPEPPPKKMQISLVAH